MASIAETTGRPATPVDLSENALYTENRWHEPFARLRREAPLSRLVALAAAT